MQPTHADGVNQRTGVPGRTNGPKTTERKQTTPGKPGKKCQSAAEPPDTHRPRDGLPRSTAAMAINLWVVTHPGAPDAMGTTPAGRPNTGQRHENKTENDRAHENRTGNDKAHDRQTRKPIHLSSRDATRYATLQTKHVRKRTCKDSAETGKDGKPARSNGDKLGPRRMQTPDPADLNRKGTGARMGTT